MSKRRSLCPEEGTVRPRGQRLHRLGVLTALLLTLSCASPNSVAARAPVYEFSHLDQGSPQENIQRLGSLPYVVHFKKGQSIPFSFSVESGLFGLEVPPLTIVAKKDIYLLFRQGGAPLLSEDGRNFNSSKHANSFMFGFSIQKDRPTEVQATIRLRAPQRAE